MAAGCGMWLLLLLVWIRRWDLLFDAVGQGELDDIQVAYHDSLTVSCKAMFFYPERLGQPCHRRGFTCMFLLILSGDKYLLTLVL